MQYQFRESRKKKKSRIERRESPLPSYLVTTLRNNPSRFLLRNEFVSKRRAVHFCSVDTFEQPFSDKRSKVSFFFREKNVAPLKTSGKILNFVLHSRESLTRWNDALERENFQRGMNAAGFSRNGYLPARINTALRDVTLLCSATRFIKKKKKKKHPLPFDYPFGYTRRASLVSALFARCSSRVRSYRDDGRDEEGGGREWRREWINPCNGAKRT